jgi:hypothetical protein
MFYGLSLFSTGLAICLTVAEQGESPDPILSSFRYKVLDIFENNRVLISYGKEKGAQKGALVIVIREKPRRLYVGTVELVEVGSQNSIGQFKTPKVQVQIGDLVDGDLDYDYAKEVEINRYLLQRIKSIQQQIKTSQQEIESMERKFGTYHRGGAIIYPMLPKNPE